MMRSGLRAMRILTVLVVALMMLVAACAPAAAPAATPAPGKPVSAPPTAVPLAATPTKAPAAVPGTPTPKPAAVPVATPAEEKPQYGGILKVPAHIAWRQLDILKASVLSEPRMLHRQYNGIVRRHGAAIEPDLAQRWEVGPDGTVYTFHLHQGVKWHDGKPFSAADIKYSLERIINPPKGTIIPYAGYLPQQIKKIETPDPNTVKVTLNYPAASFLGGLAIPYMAMMPKHILEAKGEIDRVEDVIGTGPYKVKKVARNISWESQKNPDYFVKGRPYLDGVIDYILPDPGTRVAALRTKAIHISDLIEPMPISEGKKLMEELPGQLNWVVGSGGTIDALHLNQYKDPYKERWAKKKVRQAVHYALDRPALLNTVFEGGGGLGFFLPADQPWSLPTEELVKLPGYRTPKEKDWEEARKVLAEAGYPHGFKTSLLVRAQVYYQRGGLVIQENLKKIGIEAEIRVMEPAAGLNALYLGDFDMGIQAGGQPAAVDPDFYVPQMYLPGGGRNFGHYDNPRLNQLYDEQARATDPEKRVKIVREMIALMQDEVPSVPLYVRVSTRMWWKELRGFVPGITGEGAGGLQTIQWQDEWLAK